MAIPDDSQIKDIDSKLLQQLLTQIPIDVASVKISEFLKHIDRKVAEEGQKIGLFTDPSQYPDIVQWEERICQSPPCFPFDFCSNDYFLLIR